MAEFLKLLSSCDRKGAEEMAATFAKLKAEGVSLPAEEQLLNFRLGQLAGADLMAGETQPPQDPSRITALKKQFEGWAQTDPSASARWLDGIPSGRYRDQMAAAWLSSCTRDDPAGSLRIAGSLHPSQQAIAARAVAARLAETGSSDDASEILRQLESGSDDRSSTYLRVLFDSLSSFASAGDSRRAVAMVDDHLDRGFVSPLAITKAAAGFGKEDPAAALDWAASIESRKSGLPAGEMLTATLGQLSLDRLAGAEEWISAHPEQPGIERMRAALERKRTELEDERGENPDEYRQGD